MEAALLLFFLLLGSSFAKPSLFNPEVIVASPYGNVVSGKSPIISNLPDRQYHTATGLSSFPSGSSNTIGSILGEKQLVSANKYYLQNQEFVQPKESKNSELSPSFSDIRKPSYNQCADKFSKQQINNIEQWKPPSAVYKEQYGRIIETGGRNQQSSYNQDSNSANSIASTMLQTSSESKSLQSSSQTNYNQKTSSLDTTSSIVSTGKSEDPIPLAPMLITTVNKPSCSMDQTRNNQQRISSNPIPSFELSGVSQSSPTLIPIERNNQQLSSSDAFESFVDKGTVKPHRTLALTNTAANIKSSTVTSQDKSSSASFNHHDEINSSTVVKYLGSLEKTSSDSGKDTSFQSSPSSCTKQNKLPTDHKDSNHQKEEKHGKHAKHHKSHHKESSKSHKINHNQESVPKHKTHETHHHKHKYSKNRSQESIAHKKYEDSNKSQISKHHSGKNQEKLGTIEQSIPHKKASEKFEPSTDVVIHCKANTEQKHKKHSKKHHKNKEQKENKPENNKKHKNRSTNSSSSESKHHHKIKKSADTSHVAKTSKENSCS